MHIVSKILPKGNREGCPPNHIKSDITKGLIGYWPMNEGKGTISYDLSGFGNHGYITRGSWVSGKTGRYAYRHTGSAFADCTIINMGNTKLFDIETYNRSLSVWVRTSVALQPGSFGGERMACIFGRGYLAGILSLGMGLGIYNNKAVFQVRDDSKTLLSSIYSSTTINDGIWHHLVGVFKIKDSNGIQLYVDGINVGNSSSLLYYPKSYSLAAYLGTTMKLEPTITYVWPLNADVCDARIYNRALNNTDVLTLYNVEI